jgi:hypothetical protein
MSSQLAKSTLEKGSCAGGSSIASTVDAVSGGDMTKYLSWTDILLGAWLVASPFILGYAVSRPMVVFWGMAPGALLLVFTCRLMVTGTTPLRMSWLQSLCGLWLIVASFVLLFAHVSHAALNDLIVGILVLAVHVATTSTVLRGPGLSAGSALHA